MDNMNSNVQDMEQKKAQAEANVREALEMAQLLAEDDLFNPDNAAKCHEQIINALNALKLIERVQRAQAAILKAQERAMEAMAKLGF